MYQIFCLLFFGFFFLFVCFVMPKVLIPTSTLITILEHSLGRMKNVFSQ